MRQTVSSSAMGVALVLAALLALGVACDRATGPQPTAGAVPITPPARFAVWWRLTQACSGLTGDYASVQWYVVPNSTTIDDAGKQVDAYWISNPDRVVLSDAHRDDGMTVRHEMLHVLLHRDGHPRAAYLVGCGGVVACDGECALEAGGYTSPTPSSPELQPGDVAPRLDVIPPLPAEVSDTGAVAVLLTVTNPRSEPVWVRLTPRESGDLQFPMFGIVVDYDDPARIATLATDWSQSDRLPLGAGESKHWVWESELRRGRYGVLGYFNVDTLPRQVITIGP
jgi:hypothetical protein